MFVGMAVSSFASELLSSGEITPEVEYNIKWATASLYRGMIRVAKGPSPHSVPKKTKKIAVPPQHRCSKESPFLYGISNFLFSPRGSDGNLFSKIAAALQHFWPFFKQAVRWWPQRVGTTAKSKESL